RSSSRRSTDVVIQRLSPHTAHLIGGRSRFLFQRRLQVRLLSNHSVAAFKSDLPEHEVEMPAARTDVGFGVAVATGRDSRHDRVRRVDIADRRGADATRRKLLRPAGDDAAAGENGLLKGLLRTRARHRSAKTNEAGAKFAPAGDLSGELHDA